MKRIGVFCGACLGDSPIYAQKAAELGKHLAHKQLELVYGGSRMGLMGVVAQSCLEAGGRVIGVMPTRLIEREQAYPGLTEFHRVESMHERKALMHELSDGFIAMPGGIGTLEEIMEAYTWTQLGLHQKPCGLLNINGFYDILIDFLKQIALHEFMRPGHVDQLIVDAEPEALVQRMESFRYRFIDKW